MATKAIETTMTRTGAPPAADLDTACETGCYGEDPCRLCRLRSQRDEARERLADARAIPDATAQPDLDAIEAAMDGATPGPWRDDGERITDMGAVRIVVGGWKERVAACSRPGAANARAIVAAVSAVPALVAEVRRLRAVRDAADRARHAFFVDPDSDGMTDAILDLDRALTIAAQEVPRG